MPFDSYIHFGFMHTSRLSCKLSPPFLRPSTLALHMPFNSCLDFRFVNTSKLLCGLPLTLWGPSSTHVQIPTPTPGTFDSQFAHVFQLPNRFLGCTRLLTPTWILLHTPMTLNVCADYHPHYQNPQLMC